MPQLGGKCTYIIQREVEGLMAHPLLLLHLITIFFKTLLKINFIKINIWPICLWCHFQRGKGSMLTSQDISLELLQHFQRGKGACLLHKKFYSSTSSSNLKLKIIHWIIPRVITFKRKNIQEYLPFYGNLGFI